MKGLPSLAENRRLLEMKSSGRRREGEKTEPLRLRISLQGGGAKLADLLVAMEVVEEFENDGEIEVAMIAGTSAGAIIGALYGARRKAGLEQSIRYTMKDLRTELAAGRGDILVRNFVVPNGRVSWIKTIWGLLKGKAVWSVDEFRSWLKGKLEDRTLGAMIPPVKVVYCHLEDSTPRIHEGSVSALDAVMDSSGLPFLFRMWGTGPNSTTHVDGGICENLPVQATLEAGGTDDVIVAFSFPKEQTSAPKNLWSFSGALVSAAIDASVQRSRSQLDPQNVFEIPTSLSTLSFAKALSSKYLDPLKPSDEVRLIQLETRNFLRSMIQRHRNSVGSSAKTIPKVSDSERLKDAIQMHHEVLRMVGNVGRINGLFPAIHYESFTWTLTATALSEGPAMCPSEFTHGFKPDQQPIPAVVTRFSLKQEMAMDVSKIKFRAKSGGRLGHETIPLLDGRNGDIPGLLTLFNPPLPVGSDGCTESWSDELFASKEDLREMVFTADRPAGPVGVVEFVMFVPETVPGCDFIQAIPGSAEGEPIKRQELEERYKAPKGYYAIGWRGRNLTLLPGGKFGARIHIPESSPSS